MKELERIDTYNFFNTDKGYMKLKVCMVFFARIVGLNIYWHRWRDFKRLADMCGKKQKCK